MRILYNGKIRTMDGGMPQGTALAIQGDKIVAAGSDDEVLAFACPGAEKINLNGSTVWPGLTDAHIHLETYALSLQMVDCETDRRDECLRRVADKAAQAAPGAWVRGHGWNQNTWPEGFGDAHMLDEIAPNNPVFLTAKSLHAAWANTRALQLAGIFPSTPDPQGGVIERDSEGNPTGILFESAMDLVWNALPQPSFAEVVQALEDAQKNLWSMGLTGAHDYDHRRCFMALQKLAAEEKLHLRVVKGIPVEDLSHAVGLGLRSGFGSDMLRIGSLKLFSDGALGPHTAAMLSPYENDPGNTGMLLLDSEQIFEYGQQAAISGLSVATHAIGDRANHEVIGGLELLRQYERENGLPHLRHRIEHVQILHPDDLARLASNDIIASVQPIHATSDMYMADRYWGERARLAYAFRSLREQGTHMVFGSDAPVESPNPFWGLHAVVTRRRMNGEPGAEGWRSEQRISLAEALYSFTVGPAYAAGLENRLGKLLPGFIADLIVLERDPFLLDPQEIHAVCPAAVMVGGDWVHQMR
jgi:predicted amidohydrolase YtcJ